MSVTINQEDGDVRFELELERADLLPGRLAAGQATLTFRGRVDLRGIVAALVATEQWQHEVTTTDGQGNTSSHVETERRELQRLPIQLADAGQYEAGQAAVFPLELPVPPLGPATFEGTVSRLTWHLEIKTDVPSGFDHTLTTDVVILQPTALLRAGVIDVPQFALFPSADVAADGATGSISLDPVPLCVGAPFHGQLTISTGSPVKLQEVRLELRVKAKATVSSGCEEEITVWTGHVAGEGEFGGAEKAIPFDGTLPALHLPTSQLPHGRADATFHVILAKARARDTHLVRDVTICSTTEL